MRTKAVCERHLEKIQDIADKVRTSVPYGKVDPQFIVKMKDNIHLYVGYVVDLLDQESDN